MSILHHTNPIRVPNGRKYYVNIIFRTTGDDGETKTRYKCNTLNIFHHHQDTKTKILITGITDKQAHGVMNKIKTVLESTLICTL